jgi:hypothetical protein
MHAALATALRSCSLTSAAVRCAVDAMVRCSEAKRSVRVCGKRGACDKMQRSAEMRAALTSPGAAAPAKAEWKSAEEALQLQQSRTGQDGVCV